MDARTHRSDGKVRVRRPRAEDFREAPLVAAVAETGDIAAESTAAARSGVRQLLVFAGLALLLLALTAPLIGKVRGGLPEGAGGLAWLAGIAFFGVSFYALGFKPIWRAKLGRTRTRIDGWEDTAELRRTALAAELSRPDPAGPTPPSA